MTRDQRKKTKKAKSPYAIPPKTKRHCHNCQKTTQYTYDKTIGHSRCDKCGLTGHLKNVQTLNIEPKKTK